MKKIGSIVVACALLLAGVQSAFALLVGVSVTWSGDGAEHLQNGSIVQVVAYNSSFEPLPATWEHMQTEAAYNFAPYGTTTDTDHIGKTDVYLPDTTVQEGHQIVYTGHVQSNVVTQEGTVTTNYTFQTYVYLDNANAYDSIYIRVFSATNFPDNGIAQSSYWGISTNQTITAGPGTIGLVWWTNVAAANQDYFEVIPEPGTLGMLGSGAVGVGVAGLWRRGRRKGKTREGETGVVEP